MSTRTRIPVKHLLVQPGTRAGGGAQDENGNVPAWTRRRLDAALQAYIPCHFRAKIEQSVAQSVNGVVCRFRFGKHTTKQGAQSVNRSSRSAAELVTSLIFATPKARGRCRRLAAASSASRAKTAWVSTGYPVHEASASASYLIERGVPPNFVLKEWASYAHARRLSCCIKVVDKPSRRLGIGSACADTTPSEMLFFFVRFTPI